VVERRIEPSRIRRGRLATSPVWLVQRENGETGRFLTRKSAALFDATGCTHGHDVHGWCSGCRGTVSKLVPDPAESIACDNTEGSKSEDIDLFLARHPEAGR